MWVFLGFFRWVFLGGFFWAGFLMPTLICRDMNIAAKYQT